MSHYNKKEYLFQNNPITASHHLGAFSFFWKIFSRQNIKGFFTNSVKVGLCSTSDTWSGVRPILGVPTPNMTLSWDTGGTVYRISLPLSLRFCVEDRKVFLELLRIGCAPIPRLCHLNPGIGVVVGREVVSVPRRDVGRHD